MKQMWEKKKRNLTTAAPAPILNVWKKVTPLGQNWLECFCPLFVHPLNGIKRQRMRIKAATAGFFFNDPERCHEFV